VKAGEKFSILGTSDVCVFPETNPEKKIMESEGGQFLHHEGE
jgi:hypothetical protein